MSLAISVPSDLAALTDSQKNLSFLPKIFPSLYPFPWLLPGIFFLSSMKISSFRYQAMGDLISILILICPVLYPDDIYSGIEFDIRYSLNEVS